MPGYIYKITNLIDGKSYIGFTSRTVKDRLRGHLKKSVKEYRYIHNAIRKYGKENFTISVLYENEDIKYVKDVIEPLCIQIFNTHYSSNCGYNLTYGGEGIVGHKHTEETKAIIAQASRNSKGKRKKYSQEYLREMSESKIGKPTNLTEAGRLSCSIKNSLDKKLKNPGAVARQKSYLITYESGNTQIIKNMSKFCKENNYSVGQMYELINLTAKYHRGIVAVKRLD